MLKVRDMGKAEEFSHGVLGLPVAAGQREGLVMTYFTLGNRHDFALVEVGPGGSDAPADAPGLFHVAFKVGDSLDQLRSVKAELEATGVRIDMMADHTVSQSIYVQDPDGNAIELYVDTSDVWRSEPDRGDRLPTRPPLASGKTDLKFALCGPSAPLWDKRSGYAAYQIRTSAAGPEVPHGRARESGVWRQARRCNSSPRSEASRESNTYPVTRLICTWRIWRSRSDPLFGHYARRSSK